MSDSSPAPHTTTSQNFPRVLSLVVIVATLLGVIVMAWQFVPDSWSYIDALGGFTDNIGGPAARSIAALDLFLLLPMVLGLWALFEAYRNMSHVVIPLFMYSISCVITFFIWLYLFLNASHAIAMQKGDPTGLIFGTTAVLCGVLAFYIYKTTQRRVGVAQ